MITLSSIELNTWIASILWPLTRILGLLAAAPLYGNTSVPVRVKVALGLLLTITIAPIVPDMPAADPMSYAGLLIVAQQLIIGAAMGFTMRIIFAAVEMAGEVSGMTMGFGFATFFDPMTQGRSSAISQFLVLLATLAFMAVNGHLVLLSALAESFITMPITDAPMAARGFQSLAIWGGLVFSAGVRLALPIIAALLVVNLALGILTRAAPQLNLFGIGFPITLGAGFLVLTLVLPYLATPFERLFNQGIETVRSVPRTLAAPAR
ncbi:MAG TPA: flagellar biosynthetic protein FliR [Burkholderiaceae bacterium]